MNCEILYLIIITTITTIIFTVISCTYFLINLTTECATQHTQHTYTYSTYIDKHNIHIQTQHTQLNTTFTDKHNIHIINIHRHTQHTYNQHTQTDTTYTDKQNIHKLDIHRQTHTLCDAQCACLYVCVRNTSECMRVSLRVASYVSGGFVCRCVW